MAMLETKAPAPGRRIEVPIKKATGPGDDKIHTWPHLVRSEFLVACAVIVLLTVWALLVDAPLEEPANPTRTPNPSKAPWYFLGLQEMLVFFDPWHAGVVLPSFIILGLMVIPYIDINPKGNGYYCWKDRRWEILTFFLGFHILWVSLIIIGTSCAGRAGTGSGSGRSGTRTRSRRSPTSTCRSCSGRAATWPRRLSAPRSCSATSSSGSSRSGRSAARSEEH